MRIVGRLNDERQATTFVDYLLTLGVGAKSEKSDRSADDIHWDLWVFDEDQLALAKESLKSFETDPDADRFKSASKEADRLRRETAQQELALRRKQQSLVRRVYPNSSGRRPVTMTLLVASCLTFLLTDGGNSEATRPLVARLSISAAPQLRDVSGERVIRLPELKQGQWWRVISPIFLHFGWMHILLNMMWLMDFGAQVEVLRGSRKMLLFTLVFAMGGNLSQYYFVGPSFGGMSGVVYGLFGYIWMKSWYEPSSGFFLQPFTVILLMTWFLLGLFDVVGATANLCHGVGLLLGVVFGYAPTLLRSIRKSS
ncbi:MAG: rhomboid family intramembrane serine protease [Planctomycetia bacterium]|nr:rhomboid family intramembrane serine protease [Planctomycetia bacterium]